MTLEKGFHIKLKDIVSDYLKSKGFSVDEESRINNIIVDLIGRKNNLILLFECEIPPRYQKFLSSKNSISKDILTLAFPPYIFVRRCIEKVSNVFDNTGKLPILVIPDDYFSDYLKKKFSEVGIQAWFINLQKSKIEKIGPKNKFIAMKKVRYKNILDYLMGYFFSKYDLGEARKRLDGVVKRSVKDVKFFKKLKRYFESKNFKRVNKLIENII